MQEIKIICKCGYSWSTSINDNISIKEVESYFINKAFNVGTDEKEIFVIPTNILFKDIDY